MPDPVSHVDDTASLKSLQTLLHKYRSIFEYAPVAMLFLHQDTTVYYANQNARKLFGISEKHIRGLHLLSHFKHSGLQHAIERALQKGEADFRELFADGNQNQQLYFVALRTLYNHRGIVEGIIVTISHTSVTEKEGRNALLAHIQAERYFEAAGVMIVALDQHANIIRINKKGAQITGYAHHELIGKNWIDLCIPQHLREEIHALFQKVIAKDIPIVEEYVNEIVTKSGEERTIKWHNSLINDFSGNIIEVLSTGEDITELKASQEALMAEKLYDRLTTLPNRVMFFDRLEHALLQAKQGSRNLTLLYIDLYDFNIINDTYGHDYGDLLLREFVQRMQPLLDEGDTFARIGGDEFVIIKEQLNDPGIAGTLAQQILTQMQTTPFLIARSFHYLGVSIGISLFPQNADNPKKLVQTAEMAMYRAKKEGKNRYTFYNKSLSEALYRQMEIENSLRDALENGEFELYYQPQYAMHSGKITGAEALIRWKSKTLGNVSPAEFIPIAERNRLILPIGKWVMYEACRAASDWQREGVFDGTIAVNLSGVQMVEDLGLIDMIDDVLEETGLSPDKMEIEVTESVLMQNPKRWISLLQLIKSKGIRIAIDDFGTGYSSLSYLRHFPLDLLKIDKSFVDDLPRDNDSSAIAKAVVALAKSLGLETIAEGIETEAQLHYLRDIGCDYAQGYHFSKPLSHRDFTQLLQNRK